MELIRTSGVPWPWVLPPEPGGAMSGMRKVAATARALGSETDLDATLQRTLALAVEFVGGAVDAAASLPGVGGAFATSATTSARAARAEQVELEVGCGPTRAALDADVICAPDLRHDRTWGDCGPRIAAEAGFGSGLGFRLYTSTTVLGSLVVHGEEPHAFSGDDIDVGQAFAAQYAAHVARALTAEHLHLAVRTRERSVRRSACSWSGTTRARSRPSSC